MKNKHLWIPAFVFIGACLISLVYSIIDFKAINPNLAYSTETIQFNYDGASDGKDPNGNKFDPVGFLTDNLIQNALTKSGLNYDVKQVRPYVALENIVPENIIDEINSYKKIIDDDKDSKSISTSDYHPVRYRFIVYQDLDKKLSKKDLNAFTDNIVTEYCDSFYQTYKKTLANDVYNDLIAIDGYDYTYQIRIFTSKFNILMDYAKSVYEEHNDFVVNGKSFKDLYLRAQQIIESDIDRIHHLVAFNALSKDVELLKGYYTYVKETLQNDKTKCEADLVAITAQATDYATANPNVTVTTAQGGAVITVDSNTVETYNTLVTRQVETENRIALIVKQIQECDDALDKLNSVTGDEEVKTIVDGLIQDLGQDYADLEELFNAMLESYNAKYVKEGVIEKNRVSYVSNSLFSKSFLMRLVSVSAPFIIAIVSGIVIFYLVREIRKEKKAQ